MDSEILADKIRKKAIEMVYRAKASHLGGALSMADLLAVLYSDILRINPYEPNYVNRDRFVLSKGHACCSLYATLALRGFFSIDELSTYGENGSRLMNHVSHKVPGVEFSTGSLGHGLPFGVGKAIAAKRLGKDWRTFVLLSDGEMDEGSNWEALLHGAHYELDNLIIIIDYNKIQSLGAVNEVLALEPFSNKISSFNWQVKEINGHNHNEIRSALELVPLKRGRPSCIIAHTIKGKGVDFMENSLAWHYKTPNLIQFESALNQINNYREK
jgi:transketolase